VSNWQRLCQVDTTTTTGGLRLAILPEQKIVARPSPGEGCDDGPARSTGIGAPVASLLRQLQEAASQKESPPQTLSLTHSFQGGESMLVLSRKPGEKIKIGDHITLTVVRVQGHQVRLAIDAPGEVRILRGELVDGFEMPPAEDWRTGSDHDVKPDAVVGGRKPR
jgi:carbon storage regulator